jgi:hypothetical protein
MLARYGRNRQSAMVVKRRIIQTKTPPRNWTPACRERTATAKLPELLTELENPLAPISDLWEQTSLETSFPSIPEWFSAATVEKIRSISRRPF